MEMLFDGDNISISEKKLAEYEQRLTDLQQENDQFVQLVAHDIKSPVRKLGTFIERLVSKSGIGPESEAHRYIEKIETSLADLNAMLDSMSAYADLDASPSAFGSFNLGTLINECAEEIKARVPANEEVINIKVSSLPFISANRQEIKILFRELFNNSVKFRLAQYELQINISAEILSCEEKEIFNLAAGKDYRKVIFADNGMGFAREYNHKIFQPFYRLHGKSAYPGYGLGLAIAQRIMRKHEGIIFANPGNERGAIFTIIFPETN